MRPKHNEHTVNRLGSLSRNNSTVKSKGKFSKLKSSQISLSFSNIVDKYFEINKSLLYTDVPENVDSLQTFIENGSLKAEEINSNENISPEKDADCKTYSTIEHHKIYSSLRVYSNQASKNLKDCRQNVNTKPTAISCKSEDYHRNISKIENESEETEESGIKYNSFNDISVDGDASSENTSNDVSYVENNSERWEDRSISDLSSTNSRISSEVSNIKYVLSSIVKNTINENNPTSAFDSPDDKFHITNNVISGTSKHPQAKTQNAVKVKQTNTTSSCKKQSIKKSSVLEVINSKVHVSQSPIAVNSGNTSNDMHVNMKNPTKQTKKKPVPILLGEKISNNITLEVTKHAASASVNPSITEHTDIKNNPGKHRQKQIMSKNKSDSVPSKKIPSKELSEKCKPINLNVNMLKQCSSNYKSESASAVNNGTFIEEFSAPSGIQRTDESKDLTGLDLRISVKKPVESKTDFDSEDSLPGNTVSDNISSGIDLQNSFANEDVEENYLNSTANDYCHSKICQDVTAESEFLSDKCNQIAKEAKKKMLYVSVVDIFRNKPGCKKHHIDEIDMFYVDKAINLSSTNHNENVENSDKLNENREESDYSTKIKRTVMKNSAVKSMHLKVVGKGIKPLIDNDARQASDPIKDSAKEIACSEETTSNLVKDYQTFNNRSISNSSYLTDEIGDVTFNDETKEEIFYKRKENSPVENAKCIGCINDFNLVTKRKNNKPLDSEKKIEIKNTTWQEHLNQNQSKHSENNSPTVDNSFPLSYQSISESHPPRKCGIQVISAKKKENFLGNQRKSTVEKNVVNRNLPNILGERSADSNLSELITTEDRKSIVAGSELNDIVIGGVCNTGSKVDKSHSVIKSVNLHDTFKTYSRKSHFIGNKPSSQLPVETQHESPSKIAKKGFKSSDKKADIALHGNLGNQTSQRKSAVKGTVAHKNASTTSKGKRSIDSNLSDLISAKVKKSVPTCSELNNIVISDISNTASSKANECRSITKEVNLRNTCNAYSREKDYSENKLRTSQSPIETHGSLNQVVKKRFKSYTKETDPASCIQESEKFGHQLDSNKVRRSRRIEAKLNSKDCLGYISKCIKTETNHDIPETQSKSEVVRNIENASIIKSLTSEADIGTFSNLPVVSTSTKLINNNSFITSRSQIKSKKEKCGSPCKSNKTIASLLKSSVSDFKCTVTGISPSLHKTNCNNVPIDTNLFTDEIEKPLSNSIHGYVPVPMPNRKMQMGSLNTRIHADLPADSSKLPKNLQVPIIEKKQSSENIKKHPEVLFLVHGSLNQLQSDDASKSYNKISDTGKKQFISSVQAVNHDPELSCSVTASLKEYSPGKKSRRRKAIVDKYSSQLSSVQDTMSESTTDIESTPVKAKRRRKSVNTSSSVQHLQKNIAVSDIQEMEIFENELGKISSSPLLSSTCGSSGEPLCNTEMNIDSTSVEPTLNSAYSVNTPKIRRSKRIAKKKTLNFEYVKDSSESKHLSSLTLDPNESLPVIKSSVQSKSLKLKFNYNQSITLPLQDKNTCEEKNQAVNGIHSIQPSVSSIPTNELDIAKKLDQSSISKLVQSNTSNNNQIYIPSFSLQQNNNSFNSLYHSVISEKVNLLCPQINVNIPEYFASPRGPFQMQYLNGQVIISPFQLSSPQHNQPAVTYSNYPSNYILQPTNLHPLQPYSSSILHPTNSLLQPAILQTTGSLLQSAVLQPTSSLLQSTVLQPSGSLLQSTILRPTNSVLQPTIQFNSVNASCTPGTGILQSVNSNLSTNNNNSPSVFTLSEPLLMSSPGSIIKTEEVRKVRRFTLHPGSQHSNHNDDDKSANSIDNTTEQTEKNTQCYEKYLNAMCNILKDQNISDLMDANHGYFKEYPNIKEIGIKEFFHNSLFSGILRESLNDMGIPDYDSPSEVEYVFDDSFFKSPFIEALKEYVSFYLNNLPTNCDFKEQFVKCCYTKFPLRDAVFLSSAFPPDKDYFTTPELICYVSIAAVRVILAECIKRKIL